MASATNPCSEMHIPVCLVRVLISEFPTLGREERLRTIISIKWSRSLELPPTNHRLPPVFPLHKRIPGIQDKLKPFSSPWNPPLHNRSYPTAAAPASGCQSTTTTRASLSATSSTLHRIRYMTPRRPKNSFDEEPPAAT